MTNLRHLFAICAVGCLALDVSGTPLHSDARIEKRQLTSHPVKATSAARQIVTEPRQSPRTRPMTKVSPTPVTKYPVKIRLVHSDEYALMTNNVGYVNSREWVEGTDDEMEMELEGDILTMMVPEGLNDIVIEFNRNLWIDKENWVFVNLGRAFYIFEDIMVKEDMTELTADVSECRAIPAEFTLTDGSAVELETIKWTGTAFDVVKEGNILSAYEECVFYNTKYDVPHRVSLNIGGAPCYVDGYDTKPWEYWAVIVNDVSDRWNFYLDASFLDKNLNYSNAAYILDPKTEKVVVKASDYKHLPWRFDNNPDYPTQGIEIDVKYGNNDFNTARSETGVVYFTEQGGNINAANLDFRTNPVTPKPTLSFQVLNGLESEEYWGMIFLQGLYSPEVRLDGDEWIYEAADKSYAKHIYEPDPRDMEFYPEYYLGSPETNYKDTKLALNFGNTTPFVVTELSPGYNDHELDEPELLYMNTRYYGLSGVLWATGQMPVSTVFFNGEMVKSADEDMGQFLYSWNIQEKGLGIMEYNYTYDVTPCPVGQPESVNIAKVVSDQTKEDLYPPTVTCLLPLTSNGEVNNVFDDPYHGSFSMTAGDLTCDHVWLNLGDEEDPYWYAQKAMQIGPDVTVKVEYAPYASDNWTELEAVKDDALFTEAFGNYYNIPLTGVNVKSENGWYDLRLTLVDASGNSSEQVVSPAFKVNDIAGLKAPAEEVGNGIPVYYDLTGTRLANPTRGQMVIRLQNGQATKLRF